MEPQNRQKMMKYLTRPWQEMNARYEKNDFDSDEDSAPP
jgi:hypothetical protein